MTGIASTLLEAGSLMIIGMVTVFVFLSILVFVVQLMAKFAPPIEAPKPAVAAQSTLPKEQAASAPVLAAISAAVHQYRKNSQ